MIVPPVTGVLKLIAAVEELLQIVWLLTGFTTAVGFTVNEKENGVPLQVFPPFE